MPYSRRWGDMGGGWMVGVGEGETLYLDCLGPSCCFSCSFVVHVSDCVYVCVSAHSTRADICMCVCVCKQPSSLAQLESESLAAHLRRVYVNPCTQVKPAVNTHTHTHSGRPLARSFNHLLCEHSAKLYCNKPHYSPPCLHVLYRRSLEKPS